MPETRPDLRKYDEAMERRTIHLPPQLIKLAQDIGGGTLAEGVRRALEQAKDQTNEE